MPFEGGVMRKKEQRALDESESAGLREAGTEPRHLRGEFEMVACNEERTFGEVLTMAGGGPLTLDWRRQTIN